MFSITIHIYSEAQMLHINTNVGHIFSIPYFMQDDQKFMQLNSTGSFRVNSIIFLELASMTTLELDVIFRK